MRHTCDYLHKLFFPFKMADQIELFDMVNQHNANTLLHVLDDGEDFWVIFMILPRLSMLLFGKGILSMNSVMILAVAMRRPHHYPKLIISRQPK